MATRPSMLQRLCDSGDHVTWDDFYRRYRPLVLGFAIRLSLPVEDAEEVCQDVFAEVAGKIREFDRECGKGSFRSWLFQRTQWRVIDRYRRLRRQIQGVPPTPGDGTSTPWVERIPSEGELESVWEQEWIKNRMDLALERLARRVSAKQYQAFELYELRDWPVQQVARSLGMGVATVYVNSHRLKKLLKEELERLKD